MTTLQEYDLEIKLAKIVWGQGIFQMATEAVAKEGWEDETDNVWIWIHTIH